MQSDALIESAKGWHHTQLAVLGFIGFCGVLRMGESPSGPEWLSWWSTGMSILAFLCALISTFMVGNIAFPLYGRDPSAELPPGAADKLRTGIRTSFAAIILMALASLAGWWPSGGEDQVEVRDSAGASACGTLVEGAPAGSMWLRTDEGVVTINLQAVAQMRPVGSC